jgi:uncharacterized SAM-binding protein YcdF (DUF218 family)
MGSLPSISFFPARLRRILLWLAGLLGAFIGLAFAAFYFAPNLLTVDSGECKAGALVVLGGDPCWRPQRAAELFKGYAAPLVVVSGDGDYEELAATLRQNGVPDACILRECKSGSTRENALFSTALLRSRGITNAIIVTSWYHSRRALASFRKAAPEMTFYSRPSDYALRRSDWSRTGASAHIRFELVKIPAYWLIYGISPFVGNGPT